MGEEIAAGEKNLTLFAISIDTGKRRRKYPQEEKNSTLFAISIDTGKRRRK
jgi:hypothetical protein